jgi:hypothetical protein
MRNFLIILFPLGLGLFIYCTPPRFEYWSLVRNFIPDACWAFSFTYAFFLLWKNERTRWVQIIPIVLFIGFELLQKFAIITGTFDLIDCVVYIIAYLLATVLIIRHEQ